MDVFMNNFKSNNIALNFLKLISKKVCKVYF